MIGVTGATGRLGKAILAAYPDTTVPIHRQLPAESLPVVIHAATIRGRSEADALAFDPFNHALADYVQQHNSRVVNVGSCWQLLQGTCQTQPYTALKRRQERLFADAVHVYPYWIYGPEKGFIFDLKRHLSGGPKLSSVGSAPIDLIHVSDVARACMSAVDLPAGRYAIASGVSVVPAELVARYGVSVPVVAETITAKLAYPLPNIGHGLVTVDDFITAP
jgi:nucleoside-diphosphate-sugar epimerase